MSHSIHLIVVAVANPSDLANYKLAVVDVGDEPNRAQAGLTNVALTILPKGGKCASADEISSALRASESDILYLVCHGAIIEGNPILYLEGADCTLPYCDSRQPAQFQRRCFFA